MPKTSRPILRASSTSASRKVMLLLACVVVGPFLFGWLTQRTAQVRRQELRAPDKLQVDAAALDFGEQPPLTAFAWRLPLTNVTDRPIEVLDFELGCFCTEITPSALMVSPGETREVEVIVDLQPQDDEQLTRSVREFAATIKPIFKGGWPKQDEWQLTGRVINPYVAEPAYVNYDDSLVRGMPFPSREIVVSSRQRLQDLHVKCDPPFADVLVGRKGGTRNAFSVQFTPHDSLPIGRHEFTLRVQGVAADGREMSPAGVKVFAEVHPDIEVFPAAVHLGALRVGEEGTSDIMLRSRTGKPFTVIGVDQGSATTLQLDETRTSGSDRHYQLRCRAEEVGGHVFKINFEVTPEQDGEPQGIPLVVCYSGIEKLVAAVQGPPLSTGIEAR